MGLPICSGSPLGYPVGEPPVPKPSEGSTEADLGGISSVVRIHATIIALAGRVSGRNISILVDSGSTTNYISAQFQAGLELEVQKKTDFERLIVAYGSQVHAHGNV